MRTLTQAIRDNRRHYKYERLIRKIRLRIFDYEDAGKLEKAHRVLDKCKAICQPRWDKRAKRLENERTNTLRWS